MQPTGKVRRRGRWEEKELSARAGTRLFPSSSGCSSSLLLLLFHRFKRLGLFSSILFSFFFFFFFLLRRNCAVVPLMVYGRHSRVSVVSWRRVTFFHKKKKKKKRPRRVRPFVRSLHGGSILSLFPYSRVTIEKRRDEAACIILFIDWIAAAASWMLRYAK